MSNDQKLGRIFKRNFSGIFRIPIIFHTPLRDMQFVILSIFLGNAISDCRCLHSYYIFLVDINRISNAKCRCKGHPHVRTGPDGQHDGEVVGQRSG
jgi:hypothetical protein